MAVLQERMLSPLFRSRCLVRMTPAAALMLTLAGGCLNGTAISRDPPVLLAPGTVPTLLPSAPQGDHDLAISFDHWWVRYNDPVLIILISSADAGNLDIAAAQARLEQAQSQVRGARGALLPQLTGSVGATKDIGASQSFATPYGGKTIYTGGLSASWEIDPFGGNRAGLRAAKADAQSSVATLQATRLTVIGDIARAYVDARTVKKRWRPNMWAYTHVCAGSALGSPRNPERRRTICSPTFRMICDARCASGPGTGGDAESSGLEVGGSVGTCSTLANSCWLARKRPTRLTSPDFARRTMPARHRPGTSTR